MTKSYMQLFIENRCSELDLSENELLQRTGLADVTKARRRLDQVYAGNFKAARGLIERLPIALNIAQDVLDQVLHHTIADNLAVLEMEQLKEEAKPHAICLSSGVTWRTTFPTGMPAIEYFDWIKERACFGLRFRGEIERYTVYVSHDQIQTFDASGQPMHAAFHLVVAAKAIESLT